MFSVAVTIKIVTNREILFVFIFLYDWFNGGRQAFCRSAKIADNATLSGKVT